MYRLGIVAKPIQAYSLFKLPSLHLPAHLCIVQDQLLMQIWVGVWSHHTGNELKIPEAKSQALGVTCHTPVANIEFWIQTDIYGSFGCNLWNLTSRERERERQTYVHLVVHIYVYIYIHTAYYMYYIYIYTYVYILIIDICIWYIHKLIQQLSSFNPTGWLWMQPALREHQLHDVFTRRSLFFQHIFVEPLL